jgi:hypothetical protein
MPSSNPHDARLVSEVAEIRRRLAALASDPEGPGVAEELGAIRANLRALAESNDEIGERLGELLGLRNPLPDQPAP